MTVLYFLADPKWGGWNVTLSKLCAAETAMLNNFLWNELWTFRSSSGGLGLEPGTARRLLRFHAICGIGIGLAVFFLHLFYRGLGWVWEKLVGEFGVNSKKPVFGFFFVCIIV